MMESNVPWYMRLREDRETVDQLRSLDLAMRIEGRRFTDGEQQAIALALLSRDFDADKLVGIARKFIKGSPSLGMMDTPEAPTEQAEGVTFAELREALARRGVDCGAVDLSDCTSEQDALQRIEAHKRQLAAQDGETEVTPIESVDFDGCSTAADARERLRAAGRPDLADRI